MVISTPVKHGRPPTPTEATHLSSEPSFSLPSATATPVKNECVPYAVPAVEDEVVEDPISKDNEQNTKHALPDKNFIMRWLDEDRYVHFVSLSRSIVDRLRDSYEYSSDSFLSYLRNYVKRKYVNAEICEFPFTLPPSFYALCREVMGVTHELFSGALYFSEMLPFYCSEDLEDSVFGSKGPWHRNEDIISSGAGILQLDEDSLLSRFKKLEKGMLSSDPYCRVFMFPVANEERMLNLLDDEDFLGEKIALIPGSYVKYLRHKLDVFRERCGSHDDIDFVPSAKYVFVIWMNEAYRVAHPPPQDVEECFTYWAVETFKDNEILDYDAIYRCFPPRTRRLVYKEKSLQDVVKW